MASRSLPVIPQKNIIATTGRHIEINLTNSIKTSGITT